VSTEANKAFTKMSNLSCFCKLPNQNPEIYTHAGISSEDIADRVFK